MKKMLTSLCGLLIILSSLQAAGMPNTKSGAVNNTPRKEVQAVKSFEAKTTLIEEGFEGTALPPTGWTMTDADGDGNNWRYMAGFAVHGGAQAITSDSYLNGKGALNPNNFLVTPAIAIPAGSAGNVNYWVCAQDAAWAGEHYAVAISTTGTAPADFSTILFEETLTAKDKASGAWYERNVVIPGTYAGQTVYIAFRHYNCTDMFAMNLDDVKITAGADTDTAFPVAATPTGTTVTPGTAMTLSTVVTDATGIASVVGHYKLDGQTAWTDITMTAGKASGTYTGTIPAQAAAINGVVKFTCTDTVTPTANSGDSPESIIKWAAQGSAMNYDFEAGVPAGWTTLDADGDSNNWTTEQPDGFEVHGGADAISSASYMNDKAKGALTPDNFLITQQVKVAADATVNFWVCAQDAAWAGEHYGVGISTTGTAAADFTMIFEETMTAKASGAWYEKTVAVPASYVGQNVYLAFRHFNCTDMFWLNLDDVALTNFAPVSIDNQATPVAASLSQNYPNPFNPTTTISFYNNMTGNVKLSVMNAKGETVATLVNNSVVAGNHKVDFDGSTFNSGVYFYKLETPTATVTKKMLLVK